MKSNLHTKCLKIFQVAQSEAEKKLKKDDKKKELQELNELFKPVVAAQKISKGKLYKFQIYFYQIYFMFKISFVLMYILFR